MKTHVPNNKREGGLTYIELIMVVAVISILAAIPFAMLRGVRAAAALRDTRATIVQAIERTRSRAATGYGTDDHGLRLTANAIEVFEGSTYTTGVKSYFSPNVTVTPTNPDVIFHRITAEPSAPTTITITNELGNTALINVSDTGAVTVQ